MRFATEKVVVENNYLSQKQRSQRDKEFEECNGSAACKLQVGTKWDLISVGQETSYGAGMIVGVPAGLVDSVESIVNLGLSPVETYDTLRSLFNSDNVLGNVSDAVKQSYIDRIDRMEAEYQKAGASGSFNAGVEGGKLITDIAGLAAGGAGIAKGGAVLTEKIAAKVIGKTGSATTNAGKAASGAENAATYPKMKEALVQQNLDNIAKQDARLAAAVKGSGTTNPNSSVGMGTAAEADRLGKIWVGDGAKLVTNQKDCPGCWVSADGARLYRPPTVKPNTPAQFNPTGVQANFQILEVNSNTGKSVTISNGHMSINQ
ncbi:hemolysin [Atlantibacter sp.]|uniref:hemolysin n=1 Tax=Atlantibacter sp. TaxID=1903473 RepID=UPI0028AB498A|nr:hemolysin [Atlantibacter sp.]